MRGVIAAGSDVTANAGAEILRAGGNAVDAAVGACLATAAGEPTLTSLAGGGVLLHRDGESGEVTVCDFFSTAPGLGGAPEQLEFFAIEIDFGPARQRFHVGAGSAAVPGAIPGLFSALERWGTLPLSEVIAPACRALRQGVVLGLWQQRAAALLEKILLYTEQGRRQFGRAGRLIRAGDRYQVPELADTLEEMARCGWREVYEGRFADDMLAVSGVEAGGLLSRADLAAYKVEFRKPLAFRYRGREVFTNPPPGAGGEMIAMMLALLDDIVLETGGFGGEQHLQAVCQAQRIADLARAAEGGVCHSGPEMGLWRDAFQGTLGQPLGATPAIGGGPGSTTHVSVVDEAGNAATVTFSYGEGNCHIVGGRGVMMNNLMGEEDLFPQGFHSWPSGSRLSTMMSPMIVDCPKRGVFVLGTGGANRIRSALLQVVVNLIDFEMDVVRATQSPRLHFEEETLNAEVFDERIEVAAVRRLGAPVKILFPEPNLFFGGVHLVERSPDGSLFGAGDPRRGGACRQA